MASRMEIQTRLETLFYMKVYFQPPPNLSLEYPCIVYEKQRTETRRADNRPFTFYDRYTVTHISKSYDESVPIKMLGAFRHAFQDREFKTDGLYHQVYTVYVYNN